MDWGKIKEHLIELGEQLPEISEASIKMVEDLQKLRLAEVEQLSNLTISSLKDLKKALGKDFTSDLAIVIAEKVFSSGCTSSDEGSSSFS